MTYRVRRRLGGEVPPHIADEEHLPAKFRRKSAELEKFATEILAKDSSQKQLEFKMRHTNKFKRTNNYVKYLTLRKKEMFNAIS